MNLQIENIIIWQKNGVVRNLELKLNTVNVITGESGKGKSSILHIIDYCLLSSKADGISKSNIDEKSSWYGLRLHTINGQATIARPAYHYGEVNTVYFSDKGDIPELPTHNMKVGNLKKVLDKLFCIDSELKVPYGGKTIKAGSKVSYRNFLNYCYQDQNTIVAPDYLYNKPADLKTIERIERTFQMAIGIVDIEGAIISERLENLRSDLLSTERRSKLVDSKRLEFQDDVTSLEEEAVSLGLLDKVSDDTEQALCELERISKSSIDKFTMVGENIKDLELLQVELNRKIRKFEKFNGEYREYQKIIKESDDAVLPVRYLLERYKEILPGTKTYEVLNLLEHELILAKQAWKRRKSSLLYVDINEQTKRLKNELEKVSKETEELKSLSDQLSTPEEIYRYQGKLEVKVELYSDKATPIDYTEKLESLREKINNLESLVQDIESRREFVMNKLNDKINDHLTRLKLKGYESSQAVFLERERVINLILDEGHSVEKMIDIGSASNYLYLHLSFFMALHQVARDNKVPWMPNFLVLDQVSTPYTLENADDIASLDSALKELDRYTEIMKKKGGIQIILMEHIPENHWTKLKLKNFRLVDKELVDGYGLIH